MAGKLNLYDRNWIDIVFSDRNQNYGAYVIRKSYEKRQMISFAYTLLILFCSFALLRLSNSSADSSISSGKLIKNISKMDKTILYQAPVTKLQPIPKQVIPEQTAATPQMNPTRQSNKIVADNRVVEIAHTEPANTSTSETGNVQAAAGGITEAGNAENTVGGVEYSSPVYYAQQMPEFEGGMDAVRVFIAKNLSYPKHAVQSGIQGTVYISFIVNTLGKVDQVEVLKGFDKSCDAEAARVISLIPDFKPGMQNGIPVSVRYTIPVNFSIR